MPLASAIRAERQYWRSGQKVVERLLLDRIDAYAARPPVGGEHDRVALPHTHEAEATLSFLQAAVPRADITWARRRRCGASTASPPLNWTLCLLRNLPAAETDRLAPVPGG